MTARDRSVVTRAALIARNEASDLLYLIDLALDNAVAPREISEIITHLAFYSGWANAVAAVAAATHVFAKRGHRSGSTAAGSPELRAIDEAAETDRAARVEQQMGAIMPGAGAIHDRRAVPRSVASPGPGPRDRSLITVSALIASGRVAQIPYHLIAHLAFHAGWPNAMSAVPVAKDVFDKRSH